MSRQRSEAIDRRELLKLGAQAVAAGCAGSALLSPGALASVGDAPGHKRHDGRRHPSNGWPTARLPASAAETIDEQQFFSIERLAAYGEEINKLGLRNTGGANNEAYLRTMARRLQQAGVQDVHLEPAAMTRWEASAYSLTIEGKRYRNVFYVPYSAPTGRSGLTAEMVYVPPGNAVQSFGEGTDVKGKIAVFEIDYGSIAYAEFLALSYPGGFYNPGNQIPITGEYVHPYLGIGGIESGIPTLIQNGAVGVIGIWPDLPGQWAKQYVPYDYLFYSIPGLWLDMHDGTEVLQLAGNGATATIVLEAKYKNVNTHNVIGYIPGRSSELTMLHTHTDGTNGIEENGPIPVLAAAQYIARLPRSSLERTVMVMLSSGHFAGGVGVRAFLKAHADNIVPRITAGLTLEHVGSLEFLPNSSGQIVASGQREPAAWFGPDSQGLVNAMLAAEKRDGIPGSVIRPFSQAPTTHGPVTHKLGWPGEGTYFWWYGPVVDGNQIAGPYGLLAADLDVTGMIDYGLMQRGAMSAVLATLQLTATSAGELSALPE